MLREISIKVGFDLTDYGIPDRILRSLSRKLRWKRSCANCCGTRIIGLSTGKKIEAISKVLLLSSPAYAQAASISENQQTPTEAIRGQQGLTVFSARHLINQQDRNRSGRTKLRMRQTLRTSLESMRSRVWRDQILFYKT